MGREEYSKAYKLGKKDYQSRMLHGEKPTLKVLDDIMPEKGSYSEQSLGLVQIPTEQIVGTKTIGRSNSFSGNFMPNLPKNGLPSAPAISKKESGSPLKLMNT